MRKLLRILVGLVVAAATIGGGAARADPVTVTESSWSWQGACANWWDVVVGGEPGYVTVCGQHYRSADEYGEWENRWVRATRAVQTCDANGCTDSYEEVYAGPATADEFAIDTAAGTARFRITISGETDTCNVELDLQATEVSTTQSPWPWFYGSTGPGYASAYVVSGPKSAGAWASAPYGAGLWLGDNSYGSRDASGAGKVCDWITVTTPTDWAYMAFSASSSTDVSVTPTG